MPSLIAVSSCCRTTLLGLLGCAWLSFPAARLLGSELSGPASTSLAVLTNISEIWSIAKEHRDTPHRIRTEVVIYYYDAEWNVAWGECGGQPTFMPIADSPMPLRAGQRVLFDGVIVPARDRFVWDQTQVRVIQEQVEIEPKAVHNLAADPQGLHANLVSVEGLIDRQVDEPTHVKITFLAAGTQATMHVLKGSNGPSPQFKEGDFIRAKCIYSPQFDRDRKLSTLVLWVQQLSDVQVIGSLSTDPRFALPVTASEGIQFNSPTNQLIRVVGTVRNQEQGKWLTLWDATGQVMVKSEQTLPLRFGDRAEAIGYPQLVGVQQCLRSGMYRTAVAINVPEPSQAGATNGLPLRLAEQIRDLTRQEAGRHRPVQLHALVTFSHIEAPSSYVQDASGGIRLINAIWDSPDTRKPGTIVRVSGVTAEGGFVPVVTNAVISRAGWWDLGAATPVTLEQALTGVEDGRWVELRGYVRHLTRLNGLVRLELSTSGGEFEAWVPANEALDSLKGSIVRLQGVCAAISNDRHQLTGIQIWLPDYRFIQVEAAALDDLFSVPMRALGDLRRFNLETALNRRIRTSGTVVLHLPGRYLYVQDGADSVFALSQQTESLQPGDQVEVVGFPGKEGRKLLLREAIFRRVSGGKEPASAQLTAEHDLNLGLEGLLTKADGTLLNLAQKESEARLLIQNNEGLFEAILEGMATEWMPPVIGSRLAVTGVYEIQSDEYGKPRAFLLRLRTPSDLKILQPPPWWTLTRLWWVLLGAAVSSILVLAWGILIAKKKRLLEQAQTALRLANDHLEIRVAHRTRELETQVADKERARHELSQAQESLMLASRQAGMAEVATGVLHNVGNVLNSVNVSASLLQERLRQYRVESVAKAAALLQLHKNQLARFLTEDEKGRTLPTYLEKLAENLVQNKRSMQGEIESLTRNIDHIKVVVALQQNYAKAGGVLEELQLSELVEDALQINAAALNQRRVQLIREFQPVPRVQLDRHKALQILINLINNARHALGEEACDNKLTLSIRPAGPDRVQVSVSDNGVGIAPENLNRVFAQGFTTRKDGHGFGLHSGANAAKQLGGSLIAQSDGVGKGATFTLELPVASPRGKPAAEVLSAARVSS